MSNLPLGWVTAMVADIARINPPWSRGKPADEELVSFVPMASVEAETGRLDASKGRTYGELKKKSLKAFEEGDVVVAKITPSMENGKGGLAAGLLGGRALGTTELHVLRPTSAVNAKYLMHFVLQRSFRSEAARQMTGTAGQLRVPAAFLRDHSIPLPPIEEQRRIVAAIDKHFSRLGAAEAALRAGHRRLGMLPEQSIQQSYVGEWPMTQLGEIAEIVGGVTKDAKRQRDPTFVEVPYLRVANVQRGYLDLDEVSTIRVAPEKAAALALERGDVLFNEGGDRDKLGRGWIWSGEVPGCIHQNHVFRARLIDDFDPKFVSWHGNTFGRRWFDQNGRQTTNLASLNKSTLKQFPVPAPPIEEQRRIVADIERQLSLIDSLSTAIDHALMRLVTLRRSILERAFRGELVPQDPSDEPALALLEHIAAERTGAQR